jgi:DNA helicase II / ATP-dependent DNA helicase PcrA
MSQELIPSPEQQEILDLGLTSIKVRAGAGTGKTTTVAMAIANLISDHGIEPEAVLGITFTNKAAAELADRVRGMVGGDDPGRQAEVHTYHGFAAQVLSEFGSLAGVDRRPRIITPTFARQLLADTFYQGTYQHIDITWAGNIERILKLGDRLGDHLRGPQDILDLGVTDETGAARAEMAGILGRYADDKRRLGVVDYSDLIILATRVVSDFPALAKTIRDRYRVVVLDEYQDTNPAQRVLLTTIFGDGFPVIGVGDEDQTIYEWRGASAENFELFAEHFPTPEGAPAHLRGLTLNRRSTQPILDIANQVRAMATEGAEPLKSAAADDTGTEILTFWAADAVDEAEWIAGHFERLHDQGVKWEDMAVLFRKNRHFPLVVETLGRHDIPVEVANVGGLLAVPEVADLVAWLRVIERPEDSAALAQILFGSRYRLGMADLLPLVRRANLRRPGKPDSEDPDTLTIVETLDELEAVELLRPEAGQALHHFHEVYRRAVVESQGLSLVEVCRLILDMTGAWRDIEALPTNQRLTARLNLYRLLDLTEEWTPLRGKPSVGAFLDYLSIMYEETSEDLDAARLSGADAVTLVTVHRAKGLEWENVAIPALTQGDFPTTGAVLEDPIDKPYFVPTNLRIDRVMSGLPEAEGHRKDFARQRSLRQEWRIGYVAVTRAGRRLFASGAQWYGLPEPPKTAKAPSELWTLIDDHPASVRDGWAEPIERPRILGSFYSAPTPDPVFANGWDNALRMAIEDPDSVGRLADAAGIADEHNQLVEETEARLFALAGPGLQAEDTSEQTVSVTGLVTYAQCPKRYYWTDVDPLPRRRNRAAMRGTDVHRRIELHQRGQAPLDLVEEGLYDISGDEGSDAHADTGPPAFEVYLGSRFAERNAALVEAPFSLQLESGYRVRGRIDAIYAEEDRWEIVDFKSGRVSDDPTRVVQLQAYAVAATDLDFGITRPAQLDVTFSYLGGGGGEVTYRADQEWVEGARSNLEGLSSDISAREFSERPGPWCGTCDFLRFCAPGKAEVAG